MFFFQMNSCSVVFFLNANKYTKEFFFFWIIHFILRCLKFQLIFFVAACNSAVCDYLSLFSSIFRSPNSAQLALCQANGTVQRLTVASIMKFLAWKCNSIFISFFLSFSSAKPNKLFSGASPLPHMQVVSDRFGAQTGDEDQTEWSIEMIHFAFDCLLSRRSSSSIK